MQQSRRTSVSSSSTVSPAGPSTGPSGPSNSASLAGFRAVHREDWITQLETSLASEGASLRDVSIGWQDAEDLMSTPDAGVCELPVEDQVCEDTSATDAPMSTSEPDVGVCEMPEDLVCEEDHDAMVCEAEQVIGVCEDTGESTVDQVPMPVCEVEPVSRDLQAGLSEELQAAGADQATIDLVWEEVQRATAASFGTFYDALGGVQRQAASAMDLADAMDGVFPGAGIMVRGELAGLLQQQSDQLAADVLSAIVEASVLNFEGATGIEDPCLADQIRAWLEGQLPASTLGGIDFTGADTNAMRLAITTGFATYREAMQAAVEGIADAPFAMYISGDASGLSMEMLTQSDFDARVAADDAAGNPTVDAGHFHATAGDGAGAEELQTMLGDIYAMQTTSNAGHDLMDAAVQGNGVNFDMNLIAVSGDADTDFDSFLLNTVDIADIHTAPETGNAGRANHPQSRESVYAHFIAERLHDAQNNADSVAVRWADIQTRQAALQARQNALTPAQSAIANALYSGNPVPGGAAAADVAVAQSFVNDLRTWETDRAQVLADQTARFPASHDHGIDIENDLNAERGYRTRPH